MPRRVIGWNGFFKIVVVHRDDGRLREFLEASDSVSLLVYDRDRRRILLVRQIRESQERADNPGGYITETVAGRFDCDLGAAALAAKEACEEAGVTIRSDDVVLLNSGRPMAVSAGSTAERAYLCYAEVGADAIEEAERVFGVDDGEDITRVWIPVDELEKYVAEDVRVFALIQWFLHNIKKGG